MQYKKIEENNDFYFNRRSGRNVKSVMPDSHYHNLFEVYFIAEGFCRYFIDGRLYDLTEGDVILIPGGVIHNTEYRDTPHTRLLINCSERFIPSSVRHLLPSMQYHYRNRKIADDIYKLLCCIEKEYAVKDEFSDGVLRSYTNMFFYTLARNRNECDSVEVKNEYIERAVNCINENFANDISLSDVAGLCAISSEHLSRMFKMETGLGFCEYVNLVRLKRGEEIIRTGKCRTVAETASACGFNDSNYFSVRFKKMYGISPKKMLMMNK